MGPVIGIPSHSIERPLTEEEIVIKEIKEVARSMRRIQDPKFDRLERRKDRLAVTLAVSSMLLPFVLGIAPHIVDKEHKPPAIPMHRAP